ncbi:MAG TPA: hypothetical protein VJA47_01330 [archaeon]|nr:hypothetical protein [archaeon]
MEILTHLSRYFLVPPNEIFEEQRTFYRESLEGEDLHNSLRELDETEKGYNFLSKGLPTTADLVIGAISLFTWNPSYLFWLAAPEAWRMAEMGSGWLYGCYSRRLLNYMEKLVNKNSADIRKAVGERLEGEIEVGKKIDEIFKNSGFGLDGDVSSDGSQECDQELGPKELIDGDATENPEKSDYDNEDYDGECEQDGGSSRPWDKEDGDGWKGEHDVD